MFRHTIPIGRVLGIPIDLDYSWFLIAVLITWVLAVNYYPVEFKGGTSAEYLIAVVGPLTSFALAALFYLSEPLLVNVAPALAVAKYLALINGMLGLFNLIPGFPLDGGRVFRAIAWGV